ncbi:iron response transcriptional regulator IrrA [Bartonella tribocorum]|uniref:Ferric uptake regulation protein n=1 Tax=Bartonella tribocorum TaxID=85701 RepID=A0A2M6UW67_9HYPH|nr:Fur family transcriptional regulator [Bartonella tribocorum]PIT70445.1 transcriptional repressor [Bartonella tribocorum]
MAMSADSLDLNEEQQLRKESREDVQCYSISMLEKRLRQNGLRPTRQRLGLAHMIFSQGNRHITAEELYEEVVRAGVPVSLATVYNTLHQFTEVGLLRIIAVEGSKTWFDTNTSDHYHFYIEGENRILDIPCDLEEALIIKNLPTPPKDMEISHVDLIVRLKPKNQSRNRE